MGAPTPAFSTMNGTVNIPAIAGAIEVTLCMRTPGSVTTPDLSFSPDTAGVAVPAPPEPPPDECAMPCPPTGSARSLGCLLRRAHELLVRLGWFHRLVHHRAHGADHRFWCVALEDVAAHVDAGRARLDRPVRHGEGVKLGQLPAAGHHQRHRARGGDRVEVVRAVVGLDEVGAQLGTDPGGEPQ